MGGGGSKQGPAPGASANTQNSDTQPLQKAEQRQGEQAGKRQQSGGTQEPHPIEVAWAGSQVSCIRELPSWARDLIDLAGMGVTLEYLQRFAAGVPAGLSSAEVVQQHIREPTRQWRCRFVETVPLEHVVTSPRLFISHMWSMPFHRLVACVVQYLAAQGPGAGKAGVWLDMFAINQHPYDGTSLALISDDVARLARVVASVDKTLFVMDVEGRVLTRIWCLYEVWQTLLIKGGAVGLQVLSPDIDGDSLRGIMERMDVRQAQATVDSDRQRILQAIEKSIGYEALNAMIKSSLVESARIEVAAAESQGGGSGPAGPSPDPSPGPSPDPNPGTALWQALDKLSTMLGAVGAWAEQEPVAGSLVAVCDQLYGPRHRCCGKARLDLAAAMSGQQRHAEAEGQLRQVLELRLDGGGAASCVTALAACLSAQGRHAEAEPLHREVLAAEQGTSDPRRLLRAQGALAACLEAQRRYGEAEALYAAAVADAAAGAGGEDSEAAMGAAASLAACVGRQEGRAAEAEALFRALLARSMRVRGEDDLGTIGVLEGLAGCLSSQRRRDEAAEVYSRARTLAAKVLGSDHERVQQLQLQVQVIKMAKQSDEIDSFMDKW